MPIYLLHDPILKFFMFQELGGPPPPFGEDVFQELIDLELVSTLIIAAVGTLILAILLTKLVEEPLRKCTHKFMVNHKKSIVI